MPLRPAYLFLFAATLLVLSCTEQPPSSSSNLTKGDFFPLKIGNRWTYDYSYARNIPSLERSEAQGISNWLVIDSSVTLEHTEFRVLRSDSALMTSMSLHDGSVTQRVVLNTTFFTIVEDKNHFITTFLFHWLRWEMSRFNQTTLGDTISFPTGSTDPLNLQRYAHNVGLVFGSWYSGSGHNYTTESFRLKHHVIP